jgi:N-acetylmuramoyl-L-alanine amidase
VRNGPATKTQGTRRALAGASLVLSALCALVVSVSAVQAASSRPDRTLYEQATRARATLQSSKRLVARRNEWEKVIQAFRQIVARYPQSGFSDNALMAEGDMYREMAVRFKTPRYAENAQKAYRRVAADYPSSSLADEALFAAFEIAQSGGSSREVSDAARAYLDAFPDSKRSRLVKSALKKTAPVQEASLPKPPPPGLARVFNLRFWSGDDSTRVVVDVEKEVTIRQDRVPSPDRLYVDLVGARLHPNLTHRSFPVGDGLLEQIRIAQNKDDVVRVVLDFKDVKEHSVFYMPNPTRLVIDVKGVAAPKVASAGKAPLSEAPPAQPRATPGPPYIPSSVPASDDTDTEEEAEAPYAPGVAPSGPPPPSPTPGSSRSTATPMPTPQARPSPAPKPDTKTARGPEAEPSSVPSGSPSPPSTPQANRTGSFSLARQLGLGARRIVIDAGHGGHDPGTIGRGGLQEKDLVLDVALRLEKMVRSELGAEVVMTRDSDVFIPLEERTAIANAKGADLFLSVHANSSRNSSASGIETYFLNFAANPHAEEVAARENAISRATLKDLQGLVKAITLNSKIDESRDFATSVQEAMVDNLKPHNDEVVNRGVHTAPFYVLIGANMPSVLAEIAFVSNPKEERLLKTPEYREKIAKSLFAGVKEYLHALNQTQTRQLTSLGQRNKVGSRSGRR